MDTTQLFLDHISSHINGFVMTSNRGSSALCFGLPSQVFLPKPPVVGNGKNINFIHVRDDIGNEMVLKVK